MQKCLADARPLRNLFMRLGPKKGISTCRDHAERVKSHACDPRNIPEIAPNRDLSKYLQF